MNLESAGSYEPAHHALKIQTIDAHTAGEPLRVVVGGWPRLPGATILERRSHCRRYLDHLRRAVILEPRGHADMYGCLIVPPVEVGSDFGVLFLHNEGWSTMCGHGIIGVTKVVVETGILDVASRRRDDAASIVSGGAVAGGAAAGSFPGALPHPKHSLSADLQDGAYPATIDTPAGTVFSTAHVRDGVVVQVSFRNVPSFVDELDLHVDVEGLGRVRYDLAFGGAYYAYVDADSVSVSLDSDGYSDLIAKGMAIKRAVMSSRKIRHPVEEDLGFLYGTIFVGEAKDPDNHSRNVCVFAEGEVDRSPTGTGVSGRAAIHFARGEIAAGDQIVIESILGTTFAVAVADTTVFGDRAAIIPEVSGSASLIGRSEFWVSYDDPLREGFVLR